MAGTAMTFGSMPNHGHSAPRHIPVRDADAPEQHAQPLTAFMIDPKYIAHAEERAPTRQLESVRVPPLRSLHEAQSSVKQSAYDDFWEADRPKERADHLRGFGLAARTAGVGAIAGIGHWFSRAGRGKAASTISSSQPKSSQTDADTYAAPSRRYVAPRDWADVVMPIAAMLFIIGIGIADQTLRMTTDKGPQYSGNNQPLNGSQTSSPSPSRTLSPSPSPTPSPAGSGSPTPSPSQQTAPSPSPSPTTQPVGGRGGGSTTTDSGTTALQSAPSSPLVGGRGGGDGSTAPSDSTPQTTTDLNLQGK